MNPFEKLRRAVDKVTIDYEMSQQIQNNYKDNAVEISFKEEESLKRTKSKSSFPQVSEKNQKINNLLLDQQTQYIQKINELSRKNQRLAKQLAFAESEKEQLIQQVCVLEKNNEILEEKLRQIMENQENSGDRERKYKQEIHRINSTVQMLGQQLSAQRSAKKNAIGELNKYKEEYEQNSLTNFKKVQELQKRIKILDEQIEQRTSMLEYNIKKNSEERRQNKLALQKAKNQYDLKLQQFNSTILNLRDQLSSYKANCDILNHKLDTISAKSENYEHKQSLMENDLLNLQQKNRDLMEQLKGAMQKIRQLTSQNEDLLIALKEQRQNVKLKVVEIRDQTLELELQMYKRQCKDLLQEKAISQKLITERVYEPSYQVISNKY